MTWIASAASDEDRIVAAEDNEGVVLLAHDPAAYDRYYNVVANPMLWFLQHQLWSRAFRPDLGASFHDAWRDYERVNRGFADAVVATLDDKPGAAVLFQDYHLYLAPAYVREARPDALLAHFIHIPWPADWTVLPQPMRQPYLVFIPFAAGLQLVLLPAQAFEFLTQEPQRFLFISFLAGGSIMAGADPLGGCLHKFLAKLFGAQAPTTADLFVIGRSLLLSAFFHRQRKLPPARFAVRRRRNGS